MAFKKAERTQLYLKCALFGPSGSGKTMTALRMANGIAGKMGVPYAFIDTEARSASKYADRFQFEVDDLEKKTVDNYIASMNEAAKMGYRVLIIDSLTHGWRELQEEVDLQKQYSSNKNQLSPWAKANPKQKRFIDTILNYPGHIIVTMRSKTEWVIGQDNDGKMKPEKLGLAPEQGKGIEYEFDLLIELDQKHVATVTKDRTGKFQDEIIEKPGEEFGIALYEWLAGNTPVEKNQSKPLNSAAVSVNTKTDKTADATKPALKEQSGKIISEIGNIFNDSKNGAAYFTEEEKEEARQIIRDTKLDEKGVSDLKELKQLLSGELAKRESKKAA